MKLLSTLKEARKTGRERRKTLMGAIKGTSHEFHGIGVGMNHTYDSAAIYLDDENHGSRMRPTWPENPILYHWITSFSDHRLPHAWLKTRTPMKNHVSTIDLAGHGIFCLLTGIGREKWREAAKTVGKELGVEIRSHSIGWEQDYGDVYRDWERKREVEEHGGVLVRPDRYVCWRAVEMEEDSTTKLIKS